MTEKEQSDHYGKLPLVTKCYTCGATGIPLSLVTGRCWTCIAKNPMRGHEK